MSETKRPLALPVTWNDVRLPCCTVSDFMHDRYPQIMADDYNEPDKIVSELLVKARACASERGLLTGPTQTVFPVLLLELADSIP